MRYSFVFVQEKSLNTVLLLNSLWSIQVSIKTISFVEILSILRSVALVIVQEHVFSYTCVPVSK